MHFQRAKSSCMVFRCRQAAYKLIAAKRRYHHPLNPLNQPASGGPNPLNPGGVSRPLLRQHILHIMLFHFLFLSSADGDGGAAFQEEGVLLHGLYVIHVDDEAMVALKESGVV